MAKKKRDRKNTIYLGMEGYREVYFLKFLQELFYSDAKQEKTNLYPDNIEGSTPIKMLLKACEESCKRNEVYLIIDNDTLLNKNAAQNDIVETLKQIKECWGKPNNYCIRTHKYGWINNSNF